MLVSCYFSTAYLYVVLICPTGALSGWFTISCLLSTMAAWEWKQWALSLGEGKLRQQQVAHLLGQFQYKDHFSIYAISWMIRCRADSRLAPSQWETASQSNAISHWLGANLESALRWSWDHLIFIMEIPILINQHLYIERAPWPLLDSLSNGCNVISTLWSIICITLVSVKTTWWLPIAWCLFDARASSMTMITKAYKEWLK